METTEPTSMPTNEPKTSKGGSAGPVIAIIIIIVLLALGAFYYITVEVDQLQDVDQAAQIVGDEEDQLRTQGTSNDLADIEADLNATDLSGLDSAAAGFDAELNAP